MRRKIARLYGELRFLEDEITGGGGPTDAAQLMARLHQLEKQANQLRMPIACRRAAAQRSRFPALRRIPSYSTEFRAIWRWSSNAPALELRRLTEPLVSLRPRTWRTPTIRGRS